MKIVFEAIRLDELTKGVNLDREGKEPQNSNSNTNEGKLIKL